MTTVRAGTWLVIPAAPAVARAVLADYAGARARILPSQFSGYAVLAGATGAGTVAAWTLHRTRSAQHCVVDVTEDSRGHLVEVDRNSHLVFRWSVDSTHDGRAMVSVQASWTGAGGVRGAVERAVAPFGFRRILDEMLRRLERELAGRRGQPA